MSNFYTAVEGKTFRGLPVYKFTGKREAMIDRGEFDFDGCEFICVKVTFGDYVEDHVTITPDSLPRLKHIIWSWKNTAFRYIWEWLIDSPADAEKLIEIDGVLVPPDGVTLSAEELELEHYEWHTDNPTIGLYLDWPEFGVPTDA